MEHQSIRELLYSCHTALRESSVESLESLVEELEEELAVARTMLAMRRVLAKQESLMNGTEHELATDMDKRLRSSAPVAPTAAEFRREKITEYLKTRGPSSKGALLEMLRTYDPGTSLTVLAATLRYSYALFQRQSNGLYALRVKPEDGHAS